MVLVGIVVSHHNLCPVNVGHTLQRKYGAGGQRIGYLLPIDIVCKLAIHEGDVQTCHLVLEVQVNLLCARLPDGLCPYHVTLLEVSELALVGTEEIAGAAVTVLAYHEDACTRGVLRGIDVGGGLCLLGLSATDIGITLIVYGKGVIP